MSEKAALGVFFCECGDKIAGALDIQALARQAAALPGVTWAGAASYWCLPGGVERMRAVVADQHLERVLIAGCAPRTHDGFFRRALDGVVSQGVVAVTNVRDLCARPHRADPQAALEKAKALVAIAAAEIAARPAGPPRIARIAPHAVVIGGGIAGMTAALAIGKAGIPVTLVERAADFGWDAADKRAAAVRAQANIRVITSAQPLAVAGSVGAYRVALSNGQEIEAGAIIIATGAQAGICDFLFPFSELHAPIPNLQSLISNLQPPISNVQHCAFVLCDMSPDQIQTCTHTCCLDALQLATEIKRNSADSTVTVLFRELYTAGGTYDDVVWEAQQAGVQFVRYPAGRAPECHDGVIETFDELTGQTVRVPCGHVIPAAPMRPQPDSARIAEMFRLPVDSNGFIADARLRLRPADRIERGIFVCGAVHYPCDPERAIFQAHSAAARAVRHIRRGEIVNWAPAAAIDAGRCNGCGDCARVCPFDAVSLAPRNGAGRLASVDSLLCTGCANCVSVCPVQAAQVPGATDARLEAQVRAALGDQPGQVVLLLACEWSGYSAAEIAGAREMAYPASTRLIRVHCTGRLQPGLLLKAVELGARGVMVLGCAPGLCHHERGSERAAAAFEQTSALGRLMGLDKRLALQWIPPDDGQAFVRAVSAFVESLGGNSQVLPEDNVRISKKPAQRVNGPEL